MKPVDIILIVALSVLVIGIAAHLIVKKKKGGTGCSCDCNGCPSAAACAAKKSNVETPEKTKNNEEGNTRV